ncbi:MAG: flippase-like domain-containing protein [Clostridia bacterium]|nr:flippase-like domain-containing protein [Clostridia bacterium]
MKQGKWGKIISTAVILLSLAMVLIIAFTNPELANAWEVLFTLDKGYLALAILCYAGYVYAEGAGLFAFLRMEGFRVKLSSAAHFSFAGMYYANITPSSTGGQPMQVYQMAQRGVPAGVATSALTARYFFNQLAVVAITVLLWVLNRDFAAAQVGHVAGLIVLGCVVNFACVPIIIAIMCNRALVERAALWGIRFLARRRICRQPEKWKKKAMESIDHFHTSLMDLVKHPGHLLFQLIISVAEMTFLMLVPLLVYKALGLSGTPWYHILMLSFMLFVSASYTPLPGASGAQEGGFLVYFAGVYTGGTISVALLVWRFVTYYLCLLVGCADAVYVGIRKRRKPIDRDYSAERTNS